MKAISGISGSVGFGSISNYKMEISKAYIERAGEYDSSLCNILRHIWPFSFIFGWYILVLNLILGGFIGYSYGKSILSKNVPPSYGVSIGPSILASHYVKSYWSIGEAYMPFW